MDLPSQDFSLTINGACALYPAGFVQRREWMLHQVRADRYPFNISTSFEVPSFEPLLVRHIIGQVVAHHEILRTTLRVFDGQLMQVVQAPGAVEVVYEWVDISGEATGQREARYRQLLEEAIKRPFDFEKGPLFRTLAVVFSPDRCCIHFIFHHVVSDHRSLELFDQELIQAYKVLTGEEVHCTAAGGLPYRRYTSFENELLDTPAGDRYRHYWRDVLKKPFPSFPLCGEERIKNFQARYLDRVTEVKEMISQLPGADVRFMASVIRRFRAEEGGRLLFRYEDTLFERSGSFCEQGAHGFLGLLLATLMLSFRKLSGQEQFVFDIPGSGRASRQYDQTMGWLTSGGPCYFDIAPYHTVRSLLRYVDHQLYDLSRHCVYPYEAVDPATAAYHMPAFLTLMDHDGAGPETAAGIMDHEPANHTTYQDIAFFFTAYSTSLVAEIIYNNSLFDAAMVESIMATQCSVLDTVTAAVDACFHDLPSGS